MEVERFWFIILNPVFSRKIDRFVIDRRIIGILTVIGLVLAGRVWLAEHPEHNPRAPLDLRDPVGWATGSKFRDIRNDVEACRAVLNRSGVSFEALDPVGEGACRRTNRTQLQRFPLQPSSPPTTCSVALALQFWFDHTLEPAADEIFGRHIDHVEHLGVYSCRRLYGRSSGPWSEHATSNAIDVAAFVFDDGTRISVLENWFGESEEATFLRRARDGACIPFATVLSPDYNAAHHDHFHLDMSDSWSNTCR